MENKFYSFEKAKKEPQTKQHDNDYYMSDTKDITIFRAIFGNEIIIFKTPLTQECYLESQNAWANLCKEQKREPQSRDEYLKQDCPFTDDEIVEMAEAEEMYK